MLYNKFNKFIHNYFFNEESLGENIVLAVDECIIDKFCEIYECTHSFLNSVISLRFKESWSYAINVYVDGIPQFFGLIAIQIYIASQMQEDDDYSNRMYNPRLADYLRVTTSILNSSLLPEYQFELWRKLYFWSNKNQFNIVLPTKGKKNIKYPFSHALLNNEDFKKVPLIFNAVGINFQEEFSLEDFMDLVVDCEEYQTNHFKRVKIRLVLEDKMYLLGEQLFNFYNNIWDGSIPVVNGKKSSSCRRSKDVSSLEFFVNKEIKDVCFFDESIGLDVAYSINSNTLHNDIKKHYKLHKQEFLFFEKNLATEEWNYSRFLELDKFYLIISPLNHVQNFNIDNLTERPIDCSNSHYSIKIVHVTLELMGSLFWKVYFSKNPKSFYIENGLKLDRKSYMIGAGPNIRFDKPVKAWINGEKIDLSDNNLSYSLRNAPAGIYALKIKSYRSKKIIIEEPHQVSTTNISGWLINKKTGEWCYSKEEFKISGLISYFSQSIGKASIQNWRKTMLNSYNKIGDNSSVLIRAINRAKNGI